MLEKLMNKAQKLADSSVSLYYFRYRLIFESTLKKMNYMFICSFQNYFSSISFKFLIELLQYPVENIV